MIKIKNSDDMTVYEAVSHGVSEHLGDIAIGRYKFWKESRKMHTDKHVVFKMPRQTGKTWAAIQLALSYKGITGGDVVFITDSKRMAMLIQDRIQDNLYYIDHNIFIYSEDEIVRMNGSKTFPESDLIITDDVDFSKIKDIIHNAYPNSGKVIFNTSSFIRCYISWITNY